MTAFLRVARAWTRQRWVDDALVAVADGWIRPVPDAAVHPGPVGRVTGTLLPPLTDSHVHLGLSDFAERGAGVLARVLDLGWDPAALSTLVDAKPRATDVAFAGTFLTAPGGYPATRVWAPEGSVTELSDPAQARTAVHRLVASGAAVVKVTLNTAAGPVLADDTLRAVVACAHDAGRPVVAHVEGTGQAVRAWQCGVDSFAHTPWSERLRDADVAAMAADQMIWISTLDMHGRGRYGDDYAVALDNLTRFAAAGGRVVYGTDLGNDLTSTDLNPREVTGLRCAGITGERLLEALTATELLRPWSTTATLLPQIVADPDDAVDALVTARAVDADLLRELAR